MGNAAARVTFGRGRGESARGARDEHAGAAAQVRRRRDGARRRRGERRVVVVQHAAQVHQVAPALQHQSAISINSRNAKQAGKRFQPQTWLLLHD